MKEKKIWLISKYASPAKYGVGSRLYYLAREFTKYFGRVTMISSDSNHLSNYPDTTTLFNYEFETDLKHVWIRTLKYKRSSSIKRFFSWIDFDYKLFKFTKISNEKPDIVIISSLSLTSILYGIYLKNRYNCKLVFEVRDIYPLTLTAELGFSKFNPLILLFSIIEKKGYKKADLVVGTMPNLTEHVEEVLHKKIDVYHSPLGIPEIWNNEINDYKDIDSLFPKDKFIVGYAGSMGKSNNLDSFIDIVQDFSRLNTEIHFILVGDGDLKSKYAESLVKLENVTFGPKIKQDQIPYFLTKCDLLYLSTHDSIVWKYGQSMNKVIDYMMSGKPVIASYNGYPSMINEANSGIFLNVNDKLEIKKYIEYFYHMSSTERDEYGRRGKIWIKENHSYEVIAYKYYKKLKDLFNS